MGVACLQKRGEGLVAKDVELRAEVVQWLEK